MFKLLWALLLLSGICTAQIVCNSATHYDNSIPPRICTNFTAHDGTVGGGTYFNYVMDSQDGISPLPTDFVGAFLGNNGTASFGMPYDPVIELHLAFGWQYGYYSSVLDSNPNGPFPVYSQFTTWAGTPYASSYTVAVSSVAELLNGQPNYGYSWQVTVNQAFTFTGCTGVGRWRKCHWTAGEAVGIGFATSLN